MQWRNGNAVSCNLTTSGFDSRLHVHIALVAQLEERAASTRRVRGSSPRESTYHAESERERSHAPPAKRSVAKAMSIVRSALRHAVMV